MKERKGFLYYFVRNRNGMIGMIGRRSDHGSPF